MIEPRSPFVVEEWGKTRPTLVPAGWRPTLNDADPAGTHRRGRPSFGMLVLYFGEKNIAKRANRGPIFLRGLAHSARDANEQLTAFLSRKLGARSRQVRVLLRKMGLPPDADVQALCNAIASRAKSGSHADKRGT